MPRLLANKDNSVPRQNVKIILIILRGDKEMVITATPVIAGKLKTGCDFYCNKSGEPLIAFHNTDSGHEWICHLSCLREHLELQEELLNAEKYLRLRR